MHLIWDRGAPSARPVEIALDDAGAERLADLYAPPVDRVHVRAMLNTSVDGAVAGADGTSGSLHNPADSFAFGVLRALTDCIIVGAQTVRAEDYRRPSGRASLRTPSRRPGGAARPELVVLTRTGDLPGSIEAGWPTLLAVPPGEEAAVARRSGFPSAQIIAAEGPAQLVAALAARGHRAVQCEGGPGVLTQFLAAGAIQELCLTVSHAAVGGQGPRLTGGEELDADLALETLIVGEHATLTRYRVR